MDTKKYVIFDMSEIDKINFNEVMETSKDTLRISNSNLSFVKYIGDMPPSIESLETKSIEYSYDEILDILSSDDWKINRISYTGITE